MKQLLTILCLVFLVSCSNEVPPSQLVERQRIKYEINSTTPFTGSSVSYHDNGQLKEKINYDEIIFMTPEFFIKSEEFITELYEKDYNIIILK